MNRVSLRWIVLVPILATITVGFLAFAIYIDHSDRHTRLAAIDKELARAERVDLAPPTAAPPNGTTPPAASLGDSSTVGIEPPVDLTLSLDGDVTSAPGRENPFAPDTLADLAATRERTVTEVEDHRVLVSPRPDGQVRVIALSLEGYRAATVALRRDLLLGGLVIARPRVRDGVVAGEKAGPTPGHDGGHGESDRRRSARHRGAAGRRVPRDGRPVARHRAHGRAAARRTCRTRTVRGRRHQGP